jgi:hypothetical protein
VGADAGGGVSTKLAGIDKQIAVYSLYISIYISCCPWPLDGPCAPARSAPYSARVHGSPVLSRFLPRFIIRALDHTAHGGLAGGDEIEVRLWPGG